MNNDSLQLFETFTVTMRHWRQARHTAIAFGKGILTAIAIWLGFYIAALLGLVISPSLQNIPFAKTYNDLFTPGTYIGLTITACVFGVITAIRYIHLTEDRLAGFLKERTTVFMEANEEYVLLTCCPEALSTGFPWKIEIRYPWDTLNAAWIEEGKNKETHWLCFAGKQLVMYPDMKEKQNRHTWLRQWFLFGPKNTLRMQIEPLHLEIVKSALANMKRYKYGNG